MINIRFYLSLIIMFFALLAFGTLLEAIYRNWKKKRVINTKGFRLICPNCDTLLAEVYFPSETLITYWYHHAMERLMKSKRKLGEGEYWVECYKCKTQLTFHADNIREEFKDWEEGNEDG